MEIRHILSSLKRNNALSILIVLQISITLVMVSNSVFITLDVLKGWRQPTGLKEQNLVWVYNQFYDPNLNLEDQIQRDLQDIKNLPGVMSVTTTLEVPFESVSSFRWVFDSDKENAARYQISLLDLDENGRGVLDVELIEGRWYSPNEIAYGDISTVTLPSVVLISETLASEVFPGESALGKTIYLQPNGLEGAEVIGVYRDFMGGDTAVYREVPYNTVIRPMRAWGQDYTTNYLIKTEPGAAAGLLDHIEEALYGTRGRYIVFTEVLTRTLKRLYDGRTSFAFTMLGVSAICILITALGIIGLVGLSVSQRYKQIGTRRALGATKWQVVRYFLVENSVLTSIGLVIGFILSYGLNYILATEFNNPSLIEVEYWLVIALTLWLINLLAARIPAKRAADIDPAIVTRTV
ncbi:FtsX-like permease family protein [Alteromonadaceae bacterium M269]|nr:FtsX-like permease family protein [Alteromonadaceae bacterium M269]